MHHSAGSSFCGLCRRFGVAMTSNKDYCQLDSPNVLSIETELMNKHFYAKIHVKMFSAKQICGIFVKV